MSSFLSIQLIFQLKYPDPFLAPTISIPPYLRQWQFVLHGGRAPTLVIKVLVQEIEICQARGQDPISYMIKNILFLDIFWSLNR